jgi:hypothetical protein
MDAFLLSTETVAGYQVKPWNLTTKKAIEHLVDKDLSEIEQAVAMVYIQSQPPKSIRAAMASGSLVEAIQAFVDDFPLAQLPAVSAWCTRQNELISQAQVEVVPRCDPDPKEPPNS